MSKFFSNQEIEEFLNKWEEDESEKDSASKRKVVIKKKDIKCECGAEKARTTHSHWCPKNEVKK